MADGEFDFGGLFGETDLPTEGGFAAPFTPAPEAPSAFSRFASSLGEGLSRVGAGIGREFTESPLRAFSQTLGLGGTALGAINQLGLQKELGRQSRTIERGQKQAEAAAAPAVAFGKTTLESAAAGNLTPALQAQIDQWVAQKKADARARLAAMGLGNSTQMNQLDQLIDQQAMAMKGQMLAQQEETGLAGLQTGVSAGTGVMGVSQAQQTQLASLIEQANKALGSMGASAT